MRTLLLLLLVCVGTARAEDSTGTVKASWQSFYYAGPDFKRYECLSARDAVRDILWVVGAQRVRAECSWSYGLSASWEALVPHKERKSSAALERLLSRPSPVPGSAQAWRTVAVEPAVIEARWRSAVLQRSMSDVRACNIFVAVMDYLFDELPVRTGTQSIFCQTGASYIYASLERLEPISAEPVPEDPFPAR